jgi:hypothetical protein
MAESGPEDTIGEEQLAARVDAVERAIGSLRQEIRTRRLAILDADGAERLRAEVIDGVVELQLLVSGGPNSTDGVVLFAVPASEEMPPGSGLQLWSGGDVVAELEWWEDS